MAFTLVQHTSHGVNDAGATTVAVTVPSTGSGNGLVAIVVCNNKTLNVTQVSDGTNNFTQFPGARFDSGADTNSWMADCWYLPSSTSGKTTITATFNGSPTIREILYFEVSGAVVSFSRDGVATNATVQTGSGTDDTGPSYTTHSTVGFVIGAVVVFNAVSVNPKAGNAFTAGGDIDATTGDAACSLISSSASSKQPVWTDAGTGQKYQAMTVAFQDGSSTVFDWMNQSRAEYPDRYRKIDLVPSGPMPGRGI